MPCGLSLDSRSVVLHEQGARTLMHSPVFVNVLLCSNKSVCLLDTRFCIVLFCRIGSVLIIDSESCVVTDDKGHASLMAFGMQSLI